MCPALLASRLLRTPLTPSRVQCNVATCLAFVRFPANQISQSEGKACLPAESCFCSFCDDTYPQLGFFYRELALCSGLGDWEALTPLKPSGWKRKKCVSEEPSTSYSAGSYWRYWLRSVLCSALCATLSTGLDLAMPKSPLGISSPCWLHNLFKKSNANNHLFLCYPHFLFF